MSDMIGHSVKHNITIGAIIAQTIAGLPHASKAELDDVVLRLVRRHYRRINRDIPHRIHTADDASNALRYYYSHTDMRLYSEPEQGRLMAENSYTVYALNTAEMSLTDRIFQPNMFDDRSLGEMSNVFRKYLGHSRTRKFTKERFEQLGVDVGTQISLLCHILNGKSGTWYSQADGINPRSLVSIGGDPYLIHLSRERKSGCDVIVAMSLAKEFNNKYPPRSIFDMNHADMVDLL